MRRSTFLVVLVLAVVVLSMTGCGQTAGKGNLEGWVYASSVEEGITVLMVSTEPLAEGQTAVEGASVAVEGTGITAATDAAGYFLLSDIPAGTHVLQFSKDSFEPNRLHSTVLANATRAAALAVSKQWTVLVYLDGDNNLEPYGIMDVNEMEKVGSTSDVNIVVEFDRIRKYDRTNGDWTNTRRYYILKDSNTSTISSSLVANMAEQQMDNPATLQDFIAWGVTNYPATNYLLVMWNHGAGVWPKIRLVRGACFDDTSGSSACLTTDEIRTAMANAYASTGEKMDVLAWDACLMQMLEVGYELREQCNYMVGSEQTTPGYGFPYDTMMAALTASPSMTPQSCSTMLVDKFVAAYPTTAVCSSVVDLTAWGTFVSNTSAFATALNNTSSTNLPAIQTVSAGSRRYDYNENVDLYDFASRIISSSSISDPTLKSAAQTMLNSFGSAVIYNRATSSLNDGRSHGLAILLPTTATEWGYYSLYGDLYWPADTLWNEFIVRLSSYF